MATEFEIKFRIHDLQLLDCILCDPLVTGKMQGPYQYVKMQTTYYDTESGALSARKWMLRLRQENEESVVTMKTPAQGYARGEWECREQYLDDAVKKLVAAGAPQELKEIAKEGWISVCGAQFTRITQTLRLPGGTSCAICGDIGHLTGSGKKREMCELELELTEGEQAELLGFAAQLKEKYHLEEEEKSKFVRAKELAQAK